jgi:hypothetical protein
MDYQSIKVLFTGNDWRFNPNAERAHVLLALSEL